MSEFQSIPTHRPAVIEKYCFIPTSLVSKFYYRNILMESFSIYFSDSSTTRGGEGGNVSVKAEKMRFKEHVASELAVFL